MKRIIYATAVLGLLAMVSCSEDSLNTSPAGQLSGEEIFSDPNKAQSAVDGIYRLMYTNGWGTGWADEQPGLTGFTLVRSLMGEDHLMYNQGNGWFFFDYSYGISQDWTDTRGRQYSTWNMFYTFISQANYVTDAEEFLKESQVGQNVLGQAYAIRAYSYYCLYESFCQGDYTANKEMPGVPIYTKGTTKDTKGVGRGTIEKLFGQINGDFRKSVDYFTQSGQVQSHPSHIDLYAAYGLWARAALAQQDYPAAGQYAEKALEKPGLKRVATISELGQFNNRSVADVMWAFETTADQAATYGSFVSHMAKDGTYGQSAPQCIACWLYEEGMADDDLRKGWAELELVSNKDKQGVGKYYWQTKFGYQNASTGVADFICMRAEEMLLTLAESKCRAEEYPEARELLEELYEKRYQDGVRDITTLENSYNVTPDTRQQPNTLMDEILLQRRIELWCEGTGRVPDLRRLNLGYERDKGHTTSASMEPNDPSFVFAIPLKEFDSNPALDITKDQN